ncbi:kinase-like domain-containing protein [Lipomyces oligophaga]|uniref:kinase-like domain-containing protein n=1 Tax=Lipomyces oligophaga TaxID=45792 RepID=UPI0034CD26DA
MEDKVFTFCLSKDINLPVHVKINELEGWKPPVPLSQSLEDPRLRQIGSNMNSNSDLLVSVQLFADSKPLTGPVRTTIKNANNGRKWNEWLQLPISYAHIPITAQLAITIWDLAGSRQLVPYGGTTVKLFEEKDCVLKRGRHDLRVWLGQEADGMSQSKTPSFPLQRQNRVELILKWNDSTEMTKTTWHDRLAFRQLEAEQKQILSEMSNVDKQQHSLVVEFPKFDFPVLFSDFKYISTDNLFEYDSRTDSAVERYPVITVYDPNMALENVEERKHRTLLRSHPDSLDKELKPNPNIRDELNVILNYSPVHILSDEDKDLIWRFRYYLTRDKRALTKFVKSITWDEEKEAQKATELFSKWIDIDVDEALELLGPSFTYPAVRSYAVDRLRKADDNELQLYLLQLVQALKFDRISNARGRKSSLARFLEGRAAKSEVLGNSFFWFVSVETQGGPNKQLYIKVLDDYRNTLANMEDGSVRLKTLERQRKFMTTFARLARDIRFSKESRPRKIDNLRKFLSDPQNDLLSFAPLPLPLDYSVRVVGVIPEESSVFKSSLLPLRIAFKTERGDKYQIVFKNGDDLRQDQLVIQIISLMDKLLRLENLDLKLTPYKILATSSVDGSMQFIPSTSLAAALTDYQSIQAYLKEHNPDPTAPLGVRADAMDTFVKSCAGYCVITYLLGVGDRHLDNLLLSPDGHFFHADFGYILGRDPKPFAPLMKLPIQIVEAMGGEGSEHYQKFRNYCFTAYTTLRKSANLILNLFALMQDANIPDIKIEPERAVLKVMEKFCLDMSEEEAILHFQTLINDSVSAFFPMVIDRLHNFAQYWRA